MSLFTDQKSPSYRAFMLDLRDDQGGALELLYEDLCAQFGPVSNTMKSISVGGAAIFRAHWWNLNADQFEQAFSLLDSVYRDIPLAKERAKLQASWSFRFVDPDTSSLLPEQEDIPVIDVRLGRGSSLNLTTGGKTSANAWFLFPFESASQDFEHYVYRFQKELLFKFSPNHWRLWNHYPNRGWCPKKIVPSQFGPQPSSLA